MAAPLISSIKLLEGEGKEERKPMARRINDNEAITLEQDPAYIPSVVETTGPCTTP